MPPPDYDGVAFEDMVAQSDAMKALFRTIGKAAAVKTTVLVTGESGVGKELVARALHRRSDRADGPFVAINCGAIPEPLLESELFGHVRGAFTDARADRPGLFEQADRGTMFLDEIGELSPTLQVKLLRVLQEHSVRRLGDSRDVPIDVRIVAATHRDLAADMASGRFREDLHYRLNVVRVHVPPLRERPEDIGLLADRFLERTAMRLGRSILGFDPAARRCLEAHGWPGNVRELENAIERAVVLAEGEWIGEADLPERLRAPNRPEPTSLPSGELSIKKATRFLEETLIRRALEQTHGNRTRAAVLLEISPRALLYKIREYGIDEGSG